METRIRELRKMRRMTLAELAQRIGTTPQTVQRLETANMTVSTDWLEKFADVFGVHPAELIKGPHANEIPLLGALGADGAIGMIRNGARHNGAGQNGAIQGVKGQNVKDQSTKNKDSEQTIRLQMPADDPVAVTLEYAIGPWQAGSILIGNRLAGANLVNAIGADCLVGLKSGAILLRRVIKGDGDSFTLVPHENLADVRYDQSVAWLARIVMSLNYH